MSELDAAYDEFTGEVDATPCPLTFLGHSNGRYFLLSPAGERREITARDMTGTGFLSLTEGDDSWLRAVAPDWPRGAKDRTGIAPQFDVRSAAGEIIRRCRAAGIFDPETPVRLAGIWRDLRPHATESLIVHAGDGLLVDGDWLPAGAMLGGAIYPARPPVARPAKTPAGAEAGAKLLEAVRLWRWTRPEEAEIWLGWLGQAMLGGAPRWRAHLMVTGARGSGKTWLANLAAAALGAGAHPQRNNFTEAFLRQALTGEARALILDESEPDAYGRAQAVVEMLRRMSEGEGLRAGRGSPEGRAQSFQVVGSAYLSSILHVPLSPQDKSRIAELQLQPLDTGEGASADAERAEAAIAAAGEASAGLRARAIAGWPRFLESFAAYRAAAMGGGLDARQADQLATLLAGRDLLLADVAADSDTAAEEVERFAFLSEAAKESEEEDGEGWQCLRHLYSHPIDLWTAGERVTVARVAAEALFDPAAGQRKRVLESHGMKAVQHDGEPILLVANQRHEGLARIFGRTRWADGVWAQALRYLPGVEPWPRTVRMDGVAYRATALTRDYIPRHETITRNEDESEGF